MKLSLIYARSRNRCIGQNGELPWRLPDEFKHFKQTTLGCPIIMGRRTYEDHNNILPGRTNIVLTTRTDFQAPEGLVVVNHLDQALAPYQNTDQEVFIIGGAKLFATGYQTADTVYETVVDAEVPGDTFLPPLDFSAWSTKTLQTHPVDSRHAYAYTVYRHDRDPV